MFNSLILIITITIFAGACNFNAPQESFIRVEGNDGKITTYGYQNGIFKHSPTASLGALTSPLVTSSAGHFNLNVNVSDYDGDIIRVELLSNNSVLSQKNSAPYTFSTSLISANGVYNLQIRAVDRAGLIGVSETRELTININNGNLEVNPKLLIRVGDRHYVGSILEQIFGSSEAYWDFSGQSTVAGVVGAPVSNKAVRDILERDVFNQYLLFGGVCEHNQTGLFRSGSTNHVEFRRDRCNGANLVDITRIDRESQILKVCKRLTELDLALTNAVSLVGGNVNTNPTASQIQQSFELFYPSLTYDQDLSMALNQIPATRSTAKEKWRILFEGLCQSSYWQVID